MEVIFTNRNTESIGFLVVEVRTANGAIPIENALVYVYPLENSESSIYSLRTDSSGRTERVALGTVSKDLSTSPGNNEPYTSYNVTVTAPGFYSSDRGRVPIFEGVTAILPFNLIPLSEYADPESFNPDGQDRFITIPNTEL